MSSEYIPVSYTHLDVYKRQRIGKHVAWHGNTAKHHFVIYYLMKNFVLNTTFCGNKACWNNNCSCLLYTSANIYQLASISKETVNPQAQPNELFKHYSLPEYDKTGTYAEAVSYTHLFIWSEFSLSQHSM